MFTVRFTKVFNVHRLENMNVCTKLCATSILVDVEIFPLINIKYGRKCRTNQMSDRATVLLSIEYLAWLQMLDHRRVEGRAPETSHSSVVSFRCKLRRLVF